MASGAGHAPEEEGKTTEPVAEGSLPAEGTTVQLDPQADLPAQLPAELPAELAAEVRCPLLPPVVDLPVVLADLPAVLSPQIAPAAAEVIEEIPWIEEEECPCLTEAEIVAIAAARAAEAMAKACAIKEEVVEDEVSEPVEEPVEELVQEPGHQADTENVNLATELPDFAGLEPKQEEEPSAVLSDSSQQGKEPEACDEELADFSTDQQAEQAEPQDEACGPPEWEHLSSYYDGRQYLADPDFVRRLQAGDHTAVQCSGVAAVLSPGQGAAVPPAASPGQHRPQTPPRGYAKKAGLPTPPARAPLHQQDAAPRAPPRANVHEAWGLFFWRCHCPCCFCLF